MTSYRPSSLIPVSSSHLGGNEEKYILDCLSRNWLTQGYYVQQLEEAMCQWTGRRFVLACSSGTAALHLALKSSIVPNDGVPVIVPALTYIATANAVKYCTDQVKFCDVDRLSWCAKPENIKFPEFVLGVDLYDAIWVPSSYKYPFGLDASESHITSEDGLFSTFSFYGNKLITTGEGGMVLTDDEELASKVKLYRGQGQTTPGDYHHSVIGYNYRMTDLQAAIGLAQLEQVDSFIDRRREIINRYRYNLKDDERFTFQGGVRSNGWMFALLLPEWIEGEDNQLIAMELHNRRIQTRPFFRPIPSLPPYFEPNWKDKYPVSAELYERGICLPTHVNLTDQDVDYICECLMEVVRNG